MHEILSLLLLLALEMDLLYYEMTQNNSTCSHKDILDQSRIACDAFHLFEGVMLHLSLAYEVRDGGVGGGNESPMELMGLSILERIKEIAGDDVLYTYLLKINIPPELFCSY